MHSHSHLSHISTLQQAASGSTVMHVMGCVPRLRSAYRPPNSPTRMAASTPTETPTIKAAFVPP